MLKEHIIFSFLTLFSVEDVRKKELDFMPIVGFLLIGIWFQAFVGKLPFPEIAGGAFLGVCLLAIGKLSKEAVGYGDGLLFLATGIYLGMWENLQLLWSSLWIAFLFSAVQMLVRKKDKKEEIPFVPFVWFSYLIHLGGIYYERMA